MERPRSNRPRWQKLWSWKTESRSKRSSRQRVGEAMILVEVLVLKGHVAVIYRDCQLTLTEEPLFCQVIVYFIPRLH